MKYLTNTASEHVAFRERLFELFHADTLFVDDVPGWSSRKQPRETVVKLDEVVRNFGPLKLICLENRTVREAFHNAGNLPAQVVCYCAQGQLMWLRFLGRGPYRLAC